jgi:hypothetical protein
MAAHSEPVLLCTPSRNFAVACSAPALPTSSVRLVDANGAPGAPVERYKEDDFAHFRNYALSADGWVTSHETVSDGVKLTVQVAAGVNLSKGGIRPYRVFVEDKTLDPLAYFDILLDYAYRKVFDTYEIEHTRLEAMDACNEIVYYHCKTPPPLQNRDCVFHRGWRCSPGGEVVLMMRGCTHPARPEKKEAVRAVNLLTGYVLTPQAGGGTRAVFASQSDPRGKIPSFLINLMTSKLAAQSVASLRKAALNYERWRASQCAHTRPWRAQLAAGPALDSSSSSSSASSSSSPASSLSTAHASSDTVSDDEHAAVTTH